MTFRFESVSSWKQPTPAPASAQRTALIADVASTICDIGSQRLRAAVDGDTASGKTSFGHELAAAIRAAGRPTLRASLDDFKKPWSHASEKGYDRATGEGIAEAEQLHRDRYHASEQIYIEEVDPLSLADVVIDNSNYASPVPRPKPRTG